ncbi:MAG: hypothetical protein NTU91_04275 [Chloroflexi bacterium]|nr:hypothetical protein [Chloroflexota bacterium]
MVDPRAINALYCARIEAARNAREGIGRGVRLHTSCPLDLLTDCDGNTLGEEYGLDITQDLTYRFTGAQ